MSAAPVRFVMLALIGAAVAAPVDAQQLALRRFTAADGLPNDTITSIAQDRKGYLWIGTYEGLSRFDGYRFINYASAEGLSVSLINDIVEDTDGRLWIATNGAGVARLLDRGTRTAAGTDTRFEVSVIVPGSTANNVNAMTIAGGRLWCATDSGVYFAALQSSGPLQFSAVTTIPAVAVRAAITDTHGDPWFLRDPHQLIHLRIETGAVDQLELPARGDHLAAGAQGRLLVATDVSVGAIDTAAKPLAWSPVFSGDRRSFGPMLTDTRERVWLTAPGTLIRLNDSHTDVFTAKNGLPESATRALLQDRDGTLWIGSDREGLIALRSTQIVNFTAADGLPGSDVRWLSEGGDGAILGGTSDRGMFEVRENRVRVIPGSTDAPFVAMNRPVFGADGHWWAADSGKLYRFTGPAFSIAGHQEFRAPDPLIRTLASTRQALLKDDVGRFWFAAGQQMLHMFVPRTNEPPHFTTVPLRGLGERQFAPGVVTGRGSVWGGDVTSVARVTDGRADVLRVEGREFQARAYFVDHTGRVWIGLRFDGVVRVDQADEPAPSTRRFTTRDGLASDTVWAIGEDANGHLYFGTGHGVDEFDPETEQFRHITSADGLASDLPWSFLRDRRSRLWVATARGLSMIDRSELATVSAPPSIYISRIQIAGETVAVGETGVTHVEDLVLPASRNNLLVEFVGLQLSRAHQLRYQHRLLRVDHEWSPATVERSLNYARLGAGSYRLEIRAIDDAGRPSAEAASITFEVLRPFWQRAWFVASMAVGLSAVAWFAHRFRVRHAVALERIRRQVAMDLHDELGSGLAQIAILSEVAKRASPEAVESRLSETAGLARTMRESMSDVVWAVDPRKDHLVDLVSRMREAAFHTLEAAGVIVHFDAPPPRDIDRVGLTPDRRRQILLIFKEVITNIARHARASRVDIVLAVRGGRLRLSIADNGRGFDAGVATEGHGLDNVRRRAELLRAHVELSTVLGAGTTILLDVPLH